MKPRIIRVRDLPEAPEASVCLLCRGCTRTYSAARSDYFLAPPNEVLECGCGEYLDLVRKTVVYVRVPKTTKKKGG